MSATVTRTLSESAYQKQRRELTDAITAENVRMAAAAAEIEGPVSEWRGMADVADVQRATVRACREEIEILTLKLEALDTVRAEARLAEEAEREEAQRRRTAAVIESGGQVLQRVAALSVEIEQALGRLRELLAQRDAAAEEWRRHEACRLVTPRSIDESLQRRRDEANATPELDGLSVFFVEYGDVIKGSGARAELRAKMELARIRDAANL